MSATRRDPPERSPNAVQVVMVKERQTKTTWLFRGVYGTGANRGEPPAIASQYVPKETLRKLGDPDRIVITIEPA